jgi:hypothetical protein
VTVTSLARTVEYRATDVAGNLETTKAKSIAPSVLLTSTNLGDSPDWSGSLTLFDLPVIMDHNGEWEDLGASSWLMMNGAILALGGVLISLRYRKGCDDQGKDTSEGDEGGP